jgi:hypothetical protein
MKKSQGENFGREMAEMLNDNLQKDLDANKHKIGEMLM